MNNMLPPYFNMLKPSMFLVCDYYEVRNPKIHLPTIRHDFAKQLVQYCLIKLLNNDNEYTTLNKSKIYTQTFCTFNPIWSGVNYLRYGPGGGGRICPRLKALKYYIKLQLFAMTLYK